MFITRREEGMNKSFKDIALANLPWIITSLLTIGALGATIKYQGEAIDGAKLVGSNNNSRINSLESDRLVAIEKTLVRFESIQDDIKEIKDDLKDIKKVIFRPITSSDNVSNISAIQPDKNGTLVKCN